MVPLYSKTVSVHDAPDRMHDLDSTGEFDFVQDEQVEADYVSVTRAEQSTSMQSSVNGKCDRNDSEMFFILTFVIQLAVIGSLRVQYSDRSHRAHFLNQRDSDDEPD
jgi:hypothetical protein